MAKKHKQVIILGGGLAGLTTAALLEKEGVDYILFEAQDEFGGLTRGQLEQEVWLDFGLKSIPVGDISENPLLKLKKKLNLSFAIETVTETPLTNNLKSGVKAGLIPFVGFGETKKCQTTEAMDYYTLSPRILVSNGWKVLIDELLAIIPEAKRKNKSVVTKLNVEGERIISVVMNGNVDETWTADNFVTTFPPKTLVSLLPAIGFQTKSLQKILKSESLTALSLDLGTAKRVTEHKNMFILSDDDFHVAGQFISNADPLRQSKGFQISSWVTFLTDEEAQNDEDVSKVIKHMKKQIKKAFPTLFTEGETHWERLLVVPSAMTSPLNVFHSFENLLPIGGQILPTSISDKALESTFVGSAMAGALAAAERLTQNETTEVINSQMASNTALNCESY